MLFLRKQSTLKVQIKKERSEILSCEIQEITFSPERVCV